MKNQTLFSVILSIFVASVFSHSYEGYPASDESALVDTLEFYGPLSEIYDGINSRFFDASDTVSAFFVGELMEGKMANGFAEVRFAGTHVTYLGGVVDGVMQDDTVYPQCLNPTQMLSQVYI